jgi:hypothetical protein
VEKRIWGSARRAILRGCEEGEDMVQRDWCAYCGEKFGSVSPIMIVFEGENIPIHRKEYGDFVERGLLKYKDNPRKGPFPEIMKDVIVGMIAICVIVIFKLIENSQVPQG